MTRVYVFFCGVLFYYFFFGGGGGVCVCFLLLFCCCLFVCVCVFYFVIYISSSEISNQISRVAIAELQSSRDKSTLFQTLLKVSKIKKKKKSRSKDMTQREIFTNYDAVAPYSNSGFRTVHITLSTVTITHFRVKT